MEIPEEVLAMIFSYLSVRDRHSASRVCRCWADAVASPLVWYHTSVSCALGEEDEWSVQACSQFQQNMKYLKILCDQSVEANRKNVAEILHNVAASVTGLLGLTIVCTGENPYFYSGQDLLQSVNSLFTANACPHLRHVDFRKLTFTLDDGINHLVTSKSPCSSIIRRWCVK